MSTPEFDNYKVDHLFLLIGENPLPNYVAANLLLNKGGIAHLVHTTDTAKEATRLQKILRHELNGFEAIELCSLNNYESDAYYIQKEINEKLENIKGGKIGLNYTGGTKAMSAHSYRALFYEKTNDKIYRQRENITFTYLDPRKLEMCIDQEGDERIHLKIQPNILPVELVKVFQLHGLEFKQKPIDKAQLPNLAEKLAYIFNEDSLRKQWIDWYYNVFCVEARKKKGNNWGNWKSKTDLAAISISLDGLPSEIVAAFEHENFVTTEGKLGLIEVKKTEAFTEIEHFCKWLDGVWLEHYVLQQIQDIAKNQQIKDYGLNFEIKLTDTEEFEFDVAFTRGYQLFAISCTTAVDRKLCKSKLFEAYLRARQMGGDEARTALVCCFDNPKSLKAEISRTVPNKKIAVFGRQDLANLSEKITEWITQNDREAK